MARALQRTLTSIDPDLPFTVRDSPDELAVMYFPARVATISLGVMGMLAAMLAVTGIFGMAAYSISRRWKDSAFASPLVHSGCSSVRFGVRASARDSGFWLRRRAGGGRACQPPASPGRLSSYAP